MAERGAHLSQLLLDSSRPSIFELVAQEGLNQALRGTIKFFFRVCKIMYNSLNWYLLNFLCLFRSVPITIQGFLALHSDGLMKYNFFSILFYKTIT